MDYPFDLEFCEVQFNARPGADTPTVVAHRLRKPTIAELVEREKAINLEIVETTAREEQIVTDDEAATCKLWNKLILEVRGYRGAQDWRPLADEEKAAMRPGHKTMAVRAMYAGSCAVEDEGVEIGIGADTWTVKQSIGISEEQPDYTVLHVLREPTESERNQFRRSASKVSFIRGSKRARTRINQDLTAFVKMYDALVVNVIGGTVGGKPFSECDRTQFLTAIDPTWKRLIVQTLMNAVEAALLD